MKKYLATFILSSAVLFTFITAQSKSHASFITEQAQTQTAAGPYTAIVKSDEARFTLPAPQRPEWKWRQPETKENAQEYRMDVSVKNGSSEYTFGFYLWKRRGQKAGTGSLSDLLEAGQKSVFERSTSARGFSLVPDGGIKVSEIGDTLLITISGRKNVARLFSGRPAYVTFKLAVPGEAKSNLIPVKYED
jgi:hypothetical protein